MYAGEVVRVIFKGVDFDGTPISPTNAASVSAAVYDSSDQVVQDDEDMIYDGDTGEWTLLWDSALAEAGGYTARITVHALSGGVSLGFKRMQLLAPVVGPYPGGNP